MPANIETYIGRQAAWHRLGVVTGKFMRWSELTQYEGLNFTVFKSQLKDGMGRPVDAWGTFRWNDADRRARDAKKAQFLGVVGRDYHIIQHKVGFEMVDALIGAQDGAHYETAGVLGHGERVWGLADINLDIRVGDDITRNYLLFATSYDGSTSHVYRLTPTRVVCQNTLTLALSGKAEAELRIKHTSGAPERLIQAQRALEGIRSDVAGVAERLRFLASRKLTREAVESMFDRLFPRKLEDGKPVDTARRTNAVGSILALYEGNDRNAFPEQRGSAYNMLNALTEWTDHTRSARGEADGRAASALFGTGQQFKANALTALLDLATGLPAFQAAPEVALVPARRGR